MQRLQQHLEQIGRSHRRRSLSPARGVDFTSNDYLGLCRHPALRAAMIAALDADPAVGAGGSRLLRGHHPAHADLEAAAARFLGAERALYMSTGFQANYALFTTLPDRRDAVVFDEAIHASAKEGIHAGHARRYKACHNDVPSYAEAVARARADGAETVWIAIESVYSMDGDIAPLAELRTIAAAADAVLIVDEAHATGVLGPRGRGLSDGTHDDPRLITLHTCGKALGVAGALIGGSALVIDYLINVARPFIYSTAPVPAVAAAVMQALALVDEEPWRRRRVLELSERAWHAMAGLSGAVVPHTRTPIVPVILGSEKRALAMAGRLRDDGFDVRAIRPPTVPAGTSRLRISLSADRTEEEIDRLAAALAAALATEEPVEASACA